MVGRGPRRLAVTACIVVLAAACTSETDDEARDTVGVTDDTVMLSLIVQDLSNLVEQNLAPDLGDPVAAAEAIIDEINEDGGAGGRQLELHSHVLPIADLQSPEAGRAACLAATQEDEAFIVSISNAVISDVVRCVTVQNQTIAITSQDWPESLYDDADGRLFAAGSNISMSTDRSFAGWVRVLDELGEFDGATVGLVLQDDGVQQEIIDNALKPTLDELGVELAAEAVLPLPEGSTSCEQYETAVQQMKDAEVDLLLLAATTLCSSGFIGAAEQLDFSPDWATTGLNVTDTVAQFASASAAFYDGAIGVSTQFDDFSDEAEECNRIITERTGVEYEYGSDAYGFSATNCMRIQLIAEALDMVGEDLDQASMIEALEQIDPVPTNNGPNGSWGPDKHDAGDWVMVVRYHADSGIFEIEDPTPRSVD